MGDGLGNTLNHSMKGKGTHAFDATPEAQEKFESTYDAMKKACGCPMGTKCGSNIKGEGCSRNAKCSCGSNKRHKHCCGKKSIVYMEGNGND